MASRTYRPSTSKGKSKTKRGAATSGPRSGSKRGASLVVKKRPASKVAKKPRAARLTKAELAVRAVALARQEKREAQRRRAARLGREIARERAALEAEIAQRKAKAKRRRKESERRAARVEKRLKPATKGAIKKAEKQVLETYQPKFYPSGRPREPARAETFADKRARYREVLRRAGYSEGSIRARLGWLTRRLGDKRTEVAKLRVLALRTLRLDATLRNRNEEQRRGDWATLKAMIEDEDRRFMEFVELSQDLFGLSYDEAKDEWFSPEVIEA